MDRLTIRVDDGLDDIYFAVASDPDGAYNIHDLAQYRTENEDLLTDIADRLAAYEDTDLEPEEIHQMRRQWRDTEKHLRDNCIQLRAELEKVKAERDAAIEDLKGMCEVLNSCAFCIHDLRGTNENWPTIHCNNKDKRKCWIWRGFKAGGSE
jgi:vacuolar-type H+-ATPase subunit I/STV1